jgi:hypothetical protein
VTYPNSKEGMFREMNSKGNYPLVMGNYHGQLPWVSSARDQGGVAPPAGRVPSLAVMRVAVAVLVLVR